MSTPTSVDEVQQTTTTGRICEIVADLHHVGVDHVAYDGTVYVEFGAGANVPKVMGHVASEGWEAMIVDFEARTIRFAPSEMCRSH